MTGRTGVHDGKEGLARCLESWEKVFAMTSHVRPFFHLARTTLAERFSGFGRHTRCSK